MRQSLKSLILEKLSEVGEVTLDSFFPAKYPEARLWRAILGLDPSYQFSPRTFSAILSRLRREGLVARRGSIRKSFWKLTKRGECEVGQENRESGLLPPLDNIPRLVAFDIPERERKKRDALRRELAACGFHQLQRSVWLGYRPLPDDLLELLDELNLRQYIEIVSINAPGTLGERKKH